MTCCSVHLIMFACACVAIRIVLEIFMGNGDHSNIVQAGVRTRWKPGQSGNPGGRRSDLRVMLDQLMAEELPRNMHEKLRALDLRPGPITWREAIFRIVLFKAVQAEPWAVEFIVDRVWGRVQDTVRIDVARVKEWDATKVDEARRLTRLLLEDQLKREEEQAQSSAGEAQLPDSQSTPPPDSPGDELEPGQEDQDDPPGQDPDEEQQQDDPTPL